jgi:hypothetical protein
MIAHFLKEQFRVRRIEVGLPASRALWQEFPAPARSADL